jgi:hypothetical protein
LIALPLSGSGALPLPIVLALALPILAALPLPVFVALPLPIVGALAFVAALPLLLPLPLALPTLLPAPAVGESVLSLHPRRHAAAHNTRLRRDRTAWRMALMVGQTDGVKFPLLPYITRRQHAVETAQRRSTMGS